ncbi:DUF309 domain-containing protein [Paenibacillus aurantiacus]|uniref:DUF309 domain-containing protein n=1 Tax=Paenibacillus aurantiacus TaxID=1936118 RepID=A0ABV5KZ26_9BACL
MGERDGVARYPWAYVQYLVEFHATRDYFECHELLEDHWKSHPGDPLAEVWVGLIQLAVGSYHHRRGNLAGAVKMFAQAKRRLNAESLDGLGLDGDRSMIRIIERCDAAEAGEAFEDVELPIHDEWLKGECDRITRREGLVWGAPSRREEALTDRHRLRDRTDVLAAREAALKARDGR